MNFSRLTKDSQNPIGCFFSSVLLLFLCSILGFVTPVLAAYPTTYGQSNVANNPYDVYSSVRPGNTDYGRGGRVSGYSHTTYRPLTSAPTLSFDPMYASRVASNGSPAPVAYTTKPSTTSYVNSQMGIAPCANCQDYTCQNAVCSKKPTWYSPLKNEGRRYVQDAKNFYTTDTFLNFGVGLVVGGTLANTDLDQNFRNWYQDSVRSSGSNDFAKSAKFFGEGAIFIPVMLGTSLTYRYLQEYHIISPRGNPLGNFASRTTRGYLVGAPTLLVGQMVLGAARPSENSPDTSHWMPFKENHGISGHAFMGAVPFMTAAQMSKTWYMKSLFYACSTLPAWSRVNDDAHYLSQVVLGWYLAYLSVRAVSLTEAGRLPKGLTIFPVYDRNTVGGGVQYKW